MKNKITVADVFEARKNLVRLERYAERNMDNVIIAEANTNIAAARKLLANNVRDFDNTDVTTLTVDNTEELERLERYTNRLKNLKAERKNIKAEIKNEKDEREIYWLNDTLENINADIQDLKVAIEDIESRD